MELLKYDITYKRWDGHNYERFRDIARNFANIIHQHVVIDVPHGNTTPPINDTNFNIFVWSSPSGARNITPPEFIWSIRVSCRDQAFPTSETGITLYDEETGYAVAELVGDNNLYIHHDIVNHGSSIEFELFKLILDKVLVILACPKEHPTTRQTAILKHMRKHARDSYIETCHRFKRDTQETKKEMREARKEIAELKKTLISKIRSLDEKERDIQEKRNEPALSKKSYGEEFDALRKIPKILDVFIIRDVIHIFTDTLYCQHSNTRRYHRIGKFRIEIHIGGDEDGVEWYNLTNPLYDDNGKIYAHAPHIDGEGNGYLGNAYEPIIALLANYEFSALALYAIQFVESADIDDSLGRRLSSWPVDVLPKGY